MKTVVRILYGQGGPVQEFLRVYTPVDTVVPMSTADAICVAIDELEMSGVDVDALTSLAIVAKRGLGADALLPSGSAARLGAVPEEAAPCAA